jgi:hypothetical protein
MRLVQGAQILAVAFLLASCGGGNEPAPAPDPAEAYLSALSVECQNVRFERDAVPLPQDLTGTAVADYLDVNLEVERDYRRRIAALRPPPALADEHAALLRVGRELREIGANAARAARALGAGAPDPVLAELEPKVNRRIERGNALLEGMGLPQCTQSTLDLGFDG